MGVHVEYLETLPTRGPVETLDKAYELVRGARVALALPDLLMTCPDPYRPLLSALDGGHGTDAVLGVFPATPVQPADPVLFQGPVPEELPGSYHALPVLEIGPKRPGSLQHGAPAWCWGVAAWSPVMTDFIHEEVERAQDLEWGGDWGLGGIFNGALGAGLGLKGVVVSSDPFLDIGTPEGLALAMDGRRTAGW